MFVRTLPWLLLLTLTGCTEGQKADPVHAKDVTKDKDSPQSKSKEDVAKAQVEALTTAVQAYKLKNSVFPQTLEEMTTAPAEGGKPILEAAALMDPWGKQYQMNV